MYAFENRIELRVAYVKGIVVDLERIRVVEIESQGLIHAHRSEVPGRSVIHHISPKISAKKRADESLSRAGTMV
ncbi:MAG: hypothetical protein C4294_16515 [Nitrospiraceae bacterium]